MHPAPREPVRGSELAPASEPKEEDAAALEAPSLETAPAAESNRTILKRLVLPVYLPMLLQGTLLQVIVPILPVYLRERMGADNAQIGTIVSLLGVAGTCTSAFAGLIISRQIGERSGMLVGIVLLGLGSAMCGLSAVAPQLAIVAIGQLVTGIGQSFTLVARLSFVASQVGRPTQLRPPCMPPCMQVPWRSSAGCMLMASLVCMLVASILACRCPRSFAGAPTP